MGHDPANFDAASIDIDNPYLPLAPGTKLAYRGTDVRDGKKVPHRIAIVVTDLTQVVNGVKTVVIWERDFVRNALEETEHGATPGIMMQADPRPGTPSYSEGYGPPPIFWTDRARVVAAGKTTTVPAGTYDDVLVIEEYSEQERTGFQLKSYAPGVGNVRVGWKRKDSSREVMELVDVTKLDAAGMARTRAEVRKLEQRARMYGSIPPSEVRS